MRAILVALMIVAFLICPGSVFAMKIIADPVPPTGFKVWPSFHSYHQTWTVRIVGGSRTGGGGELRVWAEGAALAEGDSVISLSPKREYDRTFTWRRTSKGPLRMRSTLRVDGNDPNSYDVYTHQVVARFQHLHDEVDTVLFSAFRYLQAIAVRDGKRFRCDEEFLVALGEDESDELPHYRRRAAVKSQGDVHCLECNLAEPAQVNVVATVGTKGKVTWSRPIDEGRVYRRDYQSSVDPVVWAAVERGLQTFQYQTAISADRPVSDYVVLTVRVVP